VLTRTRDQRGVTLIELLIALAIVAILLATGTPAFAKWMQNMQIRSAAETLKSSLITAQTEALRRNTPVRFQLTTSVDNSCTLSTSGNNYVVNVGDASSTYDPTGACGAALSDTQTPYIIKTKASTEGTRNVALNSTQSTFVFNSYGRVINMTGASVSIDLTNPIGGDCAKDGGPMTCMRLVVYKSGQIRMCNPKQPDGSPQGC